MDKHVLHKRSKDGAKIPEVGKIDYGEIAINYNKGNETFFIKNDEDEIVSLPIKSEDYVAKTGDTMTGDLIISKSNLSVGNLNKFFWYGGTGTFAFAQGRGCMAIGDYTHAEGDYTVASGSSSHAEGISTEANGEASHAEGFTTTARTIYAHAEGHSTVAGGEASHAEGSSTRALGKHSHAEGKNTDANGECSHVEGFGTLANNYTEHANGAFNKTIGRDETSGVAITADTNATLFSIGNGTGDNNRRNAFEVKWNGDAYFSGDTKFAKGITANTISASNVYNSTDIDNKLSSKLDVSVYNNDKGDFASKSDLALKADKSDTYTKTEVDGLIPDISGLATKAELTNGLSSKANTADVYSKIDMNAELNKKLDKSVYDTDKPTFATKNDLDTKEDKGVAYSKAESNSLLSNKANTTDVYTKTVTDSKLLNKADVTYVDDELINKVDKETDKGLSSNDFTNTYKIKLDDLENYDDTAINTNINGKVSKAGDTMTGDLTVEANVSIGSGNTIIGKYAFAQGIDCTAIGDYSHAEGRLTLTNNYAEHASGAYNVSISGANQSEFVLTNDAQATLFSVGNGSTNSHRNAFELKWNADAYFSGDTKFAKGVSANTISATTITSPSLDNKQEILISGTNIKTINNISLLGSGNIDIQGGGGGGGTAYTIGDGLQLNTTEIASNILSIKIDPSTQEFIYLGEKGLSITGVTNALEANVVTSVNQAIDSVTPLIKTAKTEAIDSAALDASTKANNAKTEAIAAASTDATNKVGVAKSEILSTASADASTKANNAKTEAIAAASTDATNKIGVAVTDLTTLITNETNRALGIEGGLRTDVNTKVSDVKLIQDLGNTLHYTLEVDGVKKGDINIPVNQFLKTADYDTTTNELVFVFAVESGDTNTRVFVGDLVDTYSAGNGLLDTSNSFSILIDPSSDSYLSVGVNGLKLGGIDTMVNGIKTTIEGSINAIDTKINNEIDRATKAETANTESITNLETSLKLYIDGKFNEVTVSINSLTQRIVALESNKYVLSDSIRTILPISSTDFEALPIKDSTILYTIIG